MNKNKLLSKMLFVMAIMVFAGAFTLSAADFLVDGIYYNVINDNEVEVTSTDSVKYEGEVFIPETVYGDVNGDGVINITDVNQVIDVILAGGYDSNCDVNCDGQVNITDLNVIIELILNPPVEPPVEEGDWVDLGLPSGTIWATRNIGANAPEDYGDYFAWGETSPKEVYNWNTYKWCYYDSDGNLCFSKYNCGDWGGRVDNKTELDPADDAATANWGAGARMPSFEQIRELSFCSWQRTQRNGVYGLQGIGPNGNTIFLPAAGNRWGELLYGAGSDVFYWSRTLKDNGSHGACYLFSKSSNEDAWYYDYRGNGYAVRAVRVP